MWNVWHTDLLQETLKKNIERLRSNPIIQKNLEGDCLLTEHKGKYSVEELKLLEKALEESDSHANDIPLEVTNMFELRQNYLSAIEKFMNMPDKTQRSPQGKEFEDNLLCCGYLLNEFECYGDPMATSIEPQLIAEAVNSLNNGFGKLRQRHAVKDSQLPENVISILLEHNINRLEDLKKYTAKQLSGSSFKGIGGNAIEKIRNELQKYDLHLKGEN